MANKLLQSVYCPWEALAFILRIGSIFVQGHFNLTKIQFPSNDAHGLALNLDLF